MIENARKRWKRYDAMNLQHSRNKCATWSSVSFFNAEERGIKEQPMKDKYLRIGHVREKNTETTFKTNFGSVAAHMS